MSNNNQQPALQQQPLDALKHLAGVYRADGSFQYTCCVGCRHSNGTRPFYNCWRYNDESSDDDDEDDDDFDYDVIVPSDR
jgi:hypothetical protein